MNRDMSHSHYHNLPIPTQKGPVHQTRLLGRPQGSSNNNIASIMGRNPAVPPKVLIGVNDAEFSHAYTLLHQPQSASDVQGSLSAPQPKGLGDAQALTSGGHTRLMGRPSPVAQPVADPRSLLISSVLIQGNNTPNSYSAFFSNEKKDVAMLVGSNIEVKLPVSPETPMQFQKVRKFMKRGKAVPWKEISCNTGEGLDSAAGSIFTICITVDDKGRYARNVQFRYILETLSAGPDDKTYYYLTPIIRPFSKISIQSKYWRRAASPIMNYPLPPQDTLPDFFTQDIDDKEKDDMEEDIEDDAETPEIYNPEIIQRIFCGGKSLAQDSTFLFEQGISRVLNVTTNVKNYHEGEIITYCRIPVDDSLDDVISEHFAKSIDFIERGLTNGTGSVLVHCNEGRSRAPTVLIAYLISKGMMLKDAYELMVSKIPRLNINQAFLRQLMEWEMGVRKENSIDFFKKRTRRSSTRFSPERHIPKKRQKKRKNRSAIDELLEEESALKRLRAGEPIDIKGAFEGMLTRVVQMEHELTQLKAVCSQLVEIAKAGELPAPDHIPTGEDTSITSSVVGSGPSVVSQEPPQPTAHQPMQQ
eukprot:TRINITY_DN336_c0_g1_i1.p1 TRINITY_DN336_c0_g1~~TRINITY_DN336_c0_g1_i1.p1  ORF type:complete len:647 (-),score=97.32 TRINITY_DN336_c0_g1_i1:1678-3435(-)